MGKTDNRCPITCDNCPVAGTCESEYTVTNGKDCPRKCESCSIRLSRNVEIDKPYGSDEDPDSEISMEVEDITADVARIYEDLEILDTFITTYQKLDPSDQLLFRLMGAKAKKAVIAEKMDMTLDGVYYREKRLRKILRSDPTLQDYFKNL